MIAALRFQLNIFLLGALLVGLPQLAVAEGTTNQAPLYVDDDDTNIVITSINKPQVKIKTDQYLVKLDPSDYLKQKNTANVEYFEYAKHFIEDCSGLPGLTFPNCTTPDTCRDIAILTNNTYVTIHADNTSCLDPLLLSSSVEFIEQDRTFYTDQLCVTEENPIWNLDYINRASGVGNDDRYYDYDPDRSGNGVYVYVIDTGIKTSLSEFGGRSAYGTTTCADHTGFGGCTCRINTDRDGHGTHVAGTVMSNRWGVARRANAIAVKALDDCGTGLTSEILQAFRWALQNIVSNGRLGKALINFSAGGGASRTMDSVVKQVTDTGVPVVVAAGNANRDACNYSPSRLPSAITVASHDSRSRISSFSNDGSCVDISGPGSSIRSADLSRSSGSVKSGTSMSAPHVSGSVAIYLSTAGFSSTTPPSTITSSTMNYLLTTSVSGLRGASRSTPDRILKLPALTCQIGRLADSSNSNMTTTSTTTTTTTPRPSGRRRPGRRRGWWWGRRPRRRG